MEGAVLLVPIFAVLGFFSSIIIFIYMFFNSWHKQRMALIEHGKDASIFRQYKDGNPGQALKLGLVAVAIGFGVLAGYLFSRLGLPAAVAYFAMILMLGGGGLLLFYRIMRDRELEI